MNNNDDRVVVMGDLINASNMRHVPKKQVWLKIDFPFSYLPL